MRRIAIPLNAPNKTAPLRARPLGKCTLLISIKAKKIMANAEKVTMKNGRPAIKGKCPDCGTGMYKIVSNKG